MESSLFKKLESVGLRILNMTILEDEKSVRILIGNIGSELEFLFQEPSILPKSENPLDDWTKLELETIAKELDSQVEYPFIGPPFSPFISWAKENNQFFVSPIKILIHPQYGLWTGLRGALFVDKKKLPADDYQRLINDFADKKNQSPCDSCQGKYCLKNCPVDAFRNDQYFVSDCKKEISKKEQCYSDGCQARLACPIGTHYGPRQRAFHMKAFMRNYA